MARGIARTTVKDGEAKQGITDQGKDEDSSPSPVNLGDQAGLKRGLDECAVNVRSSSMAFELVSKLTSLQIFMLSRPSLGVITILGSVNLALLSLQTILDAGYEEDHLVSNVKIGLGGIT